MTDNRKIVWHYTAGDYLVHIEASGELRPTSVQISQRERPVLWFSANQQWEPTAAKAIMQNGVRKGLTKMEHFEHAGGIVRFGADISNPNYQFVPWAKLQRAAKIPRNVAKGLKKAAHDVGADPSDWYGLLGSLPLSECVAIEAAEARPNGSDRLVWREVTIAKNEPLSSLIHNQK